MKRLFNVFWKKELKFWNRIMGIKETTNYVIFFFISLILGILHYAFAGMHFLFEITMLIFSRPTFELNMNKLEKQLAL